MQNIKLIPARQPILWTNAKDNDVKFQKTEKTAELYADVKAHHLAKR